MTHEEKLSLIDSKPDYDIEEVISHHHEERLGSVTCHYHHYHSERINEGYHDPSFEFLTVDVLAQVREESYMVAERLS
jgi:hypothetical protein